MGVGVFEDDKESLVAVADVLAGVVELAAALLADVDELESPPSPTFDTAPETTEWTAPCRLLKTLASSPFACVRANNTANIDSRRIRGTENIMMTVCVLMEKEDGKWREK